MMTGPTLDWLAAAGVVGIIVTFSLGVVGAKFELYPFYHMRIPKQIEKNHINMENIHIFLLLFVESCCRIHSILQMNISG